MRPIYICIALTVFLISCAARQTLTPVEADAEFERGQAFFENKKYNKALESFERILFYHPSSAYVDNAQYWLGRTYLAKKDYDQATVEFDYLIRNFPNSDQLEDAYFYRAKAYVHGAPGYEKDLSDLEKAIRYFDEFLTQYPNSKYTEDVRNEILAARNRLAKKELESGKLYEKLKEPNAAIYYYKYILERYPETESAGEAKYRSARIHERNGRVEQALNLYRELLDDIDWGTEAAKRIKDLEKGS
jgi:outer membrane protein assembly factor BamD